MGIFVKENTKFKNVEERKKKQQAIDMYGQEGELKLERERKQSKAKQSKAKGRREKKSLRTSSLERNDSYYLQ